MMRGKVRGLLPGKYGGTGVKEPENSWQVFYEETEEAQNAEKAEKIRQGSAPEKIPGYVPAREKTAERQQEKTNRGTSGRMSDYAAYCKRGAGSYAGIGRRRK